MKAPSVHAAASHHGCENELSRLSTETSLLLQRCSSEIQNLTTREVWKNSPDVASIGSQTASLQSRSSTHKIDCRNMMKRAHHNCESAMMVWLAMTLLLCIPLAAFQPTAVPSSSTPQRNAMKGLYMMSTEPILGTSEGPGCAAFQSSCVGLHGQTCIVSDWFPFPLCSGDHAEKNGNAA
jgi:hypothetical protein